MSAKNRKIVSILIKKYGRRNGLHSRCRYFPYNFFAMARDILKIKQDSNDSSTWTRHIFFGDIKDSSQASASGIVHVYGQSLFNADNTEKNISLLRKLGIDV